MKPSPKVLGIRLTPLRHKFSVFATTMLPYHISVSLGDVGYIMTRATFQPRHSLISVTAGVTRVALAQLARQSTAHTLRILFTRNLVATLRRTRSLAWTQRRAAFIRSRH